MKARVIVLVAAVSLLLGPEAWGQQADPSESPKRALVKEYMELVNLTKMMDAAGMAMANSMTSPKDTPPAMAKAFTEAASESIAVVFPQMQSRMIDLYENAMTEEELKALIVFYGSPIGRAVTSKTEQLMSATTPIIREFGPVMEREMLIRMCGKIDCPKDLKATVKRLKAENP